MPSSGRRSFSRAGSRAVALSSVLVVTPHQIVRRRRLWWRSGQVARYHASRARQKPLIWSTDLGPPASRRYSRKIGIGSIQWPSPSITGCLSPARISAARCSMVVSSHESEKVTFAICHPPSGNGGHDLFREALHRAQHALVLQVAEPEVAVEMRDAHFLLQAPDLADAGVGRPDDEHVLEQLFLGGLLLSRNRNGDAFLHALLLVAQAQRYPHVPARVLNGVTRVGGAVRDVYRSLHADARRLLRLDVCHHLAEQLAVVGELLDRDAEAAGEHVEAALHCCLYRVRALRRDPYRRVRLLCGLGEDARFRKLEVLALVGERLPLERLEDDVDGLVPALAPLVELEAEALELVLLVAAPEADVEAAAAHHVERRDLFRDHQWMVQGHHDDDRDYTEPRRLPGDIGRELDGAGQVAVGGEVVLGQPAAPEAERLGGLRQLDAARVDLLRGAGGGRLQQQERSEVHILFPLLR